MENKKNSKDSIIDKDKKIVKVKPSTKKTATKKTKPVDKKVGTKKVEPKADLKKSEEIIEPIIIESKETITPLSQATINPNNLKKITSFWDFDPEREEEEAARVVYSEEQIQKKKWGFLAMMLFFFVPSLVAIIVYQIVNTFNYSDNDKQTITIIISQIVGALVIAGVMLKVCLDLKPSFANTFKRTDKDRDKISSLNNAIGKIDDENKKGLFSLKSKRFYFKYRYPINFVVAIVSYYILVTLLSLFTASIGGGVSDNQTDVETMINAFPVGGFFLVVMAAPLSEELFARYGIFNYVRNRKTAIIVSTTLFALMHVFGAMLGEAGLKAFLDIFPYLAGGFTFAMLYHLNDEKIAYPMALHALTNLIAYIVIMA